MRRIDSVASRHALCLCSSHRQHPLTRCVPVLPVYLFSQNRIPTNRRAFSLVELLVVMSITLVMSGLTAQAVQRVRERAARMHCHNNLRQLGLAITHHESSVGRFPLGVIRQTWPTYVNPAYQCPLPYSDSTRYAQYWPWSVFILPYLEGDSIHTRIDWKNYPWTQAIGSTPFVTYQCAWDIRGQIAYNLMGRVQYCTTYLGVSGTNQFSDDGVFAANRSRQAHEITDGLSNTLMVGERPPSTKGWFGWWAGGMGESPYFGTCDTILGTSETLYGQPTATFRSGDWNDPTDMDRAHFWSSHPSGASFLFAGGSVHFLRYTMKQELLQAMGTIAGGEALSE